MCINTSTFTYKVKLYNTWTANLFTGDLPPSVSAFTPQPGPNVPPTCETPEDFFSLFFDDDLLKYIKDNTNEYAEHKISTMRATRRGLYGNWKPVSLDEMKGFLAVILNMGIIQLKDIKDYWLLNDTTNLPFFRSVFSRDRFLQIFGALHVGSIGSNTKRDKVQPFLDKVSPSFARLFTPAQQIAIDESVIAFRGRVSFRQYLKGKPHPWGIKAFVLADSNTGYLSQVCIYYGKETQLVDQALPHTAKVVMTLVQPYHHLGYDLYVDRFYSSPLLCTELTKVGITVTGTVQANRRGLPKDITAKRKEPPGTVKAARSNNMMALSWVDKRKVLMLSTKHSHSMVQVTTRYVCMFVFAVRACWGVRVCGVCVYRLYIVHVCVGCTVCMCVTCSVCMCVCGMCLCVGCKACICMFDVHVCVCVFRTKGVRIHLDYKWMRVLVCVSVWCMGVPVCDSALCVCVCEKYHDNNLNIICKMYV